MVDAPKERHPVVLRGPVALDAFRAAILLSGDRGPWASKPRWTTEMKTGALFVLLAGALATSVWCWSSNVDEPFTRPPPDALADSLPAVPPDAAARVSAPPFVLPPPNPYESPTCKHPPVVPRCDGEWCTLPKGCFLMGSPVTAKRRAGLGEEEREVLVHARSRRRPLRDDAGGLGIGGPPQPQPYRPPRPGERLPRSALPDRQRDLVRCLGLRKRAKRSRRT